MLKIKVVPERGMRGPLVRDRQGKHPKSGHYCNKGFHGSGKRIGGFIKERLMLRKQFFYCDSPFYVMKVLYFKILLLVVMCILSITGNNTAKFLLR